MFRDTSSKIDQPQQPSSFFDKAVGVANTVLDFSLRPATRAATALIKTFSGDKNIINPSTTAEKVFYGNEPIGDVTQYGKTSLAGFGIKPKSDLGGLVLGSIMAPLDLLASPGKTSKQVIIKIANETKDVKKVFSDLKSFKISDSIRQEIAPNLLREKDPNAIANIIRNAEVVSDIEKKTGVSVPAPMRAKIGEALANTKFSSAKESDVFIEKMKADIIASAPEAKTIITDVKNISGKVDGDIQKAKDAILQSPTLSKSEIETIKSTDSIDEILKIVKTKGADTQGMFLTRLETNFKSKEPFTEIKQSLKEAKPQIVKAPTVTKVLGKLPEKKAKVKGSQAMKKSLKAQEKAGQAGLKRGTSLGRKLGTFKAKAKEKIKVQEIHQSYQKKATTLANFRKSVRQYVSDLPKAVQRRVLSQVRFSEVKTGKQLNSILDTVDKARAGVKEEIKRKKTWKELAPLLKSLREKDKLGDLIPTIKKLGFVNKQGKQLENIREAIKKAPRAKLEEILAAAKNSLDTTPPKIDVSKVDWEKVAKEGVGSSKGKTVMQKIGEGLESSLGVVSTNIRKYGGDELFSKVREWQFKLNRTSKIATDEMKGFQKGLTKMRKKWFGGKADYENMTHALFNQDFVRAREIARKYKFEGEIDKVIGILDDIHARANKAGLKVGKMTDYFTRVVKDYDGLFKAYNEKFGQKGRSFLDKVLNNYAKSKFKRVTELSAEERAGVLTNALRGYGQGKINVGNVSRARKFRELPTDLMKFYHTPEKSLVMYVDSMNKKIALKEMFGLEGAEQESIGSMLDGLNLAPNDLYRLKENLGAILAPQGTENLVLNKLRKSATLTLLSNFASTLFQIADIGKNAWKFGIFRAVASLFRKKPFKREEMFTEIAHEFSDSNVIKNALKIAGFDRLDRLNNEAFMANTFREAVRSAKKGSGSGFKDLEEYAGVVFRGDKDRIGKFLDDVRNKKVTEDTRLYVFNKVLDVDPRSLTEMPEAYAKNPNARIFYSMKSYGIKVLDIYRQELRSGKPTWKKAKNLFFLTTYLTAAGATGSQIRDWYNGKETKFSDNVMNSALQLMLLSSYDVSNIQQDGLGKTIMGKALPPSRLIDDVSRDIWNAGDGKGLQSVRNIPVLGNEYYNRVGKGKETIKKFNKKANGSTSIKTIRGGSAKSGRLKGKQAAGVV